MSDDTRVKNPTPEDAIEQGRKDALRNSGKAYEPDTATEDAVAEGQDTAEHNIKADKANGFDPEGHTEHPLKNETTKAAKVRTAQSQLDPSGEDPISKKQVEESAVAAGPTTGNETSVSNEEAAKRAENPGQAEEESPVSTAQGEGVDEGEDKTPADKE